MKDASGTRDRAAVLRRALVELRELRARAGAAQAGPRPIAIVGVGCRFPGNADSPAAFWRLLRDGVAATSEAPWQRWSLRPPHRALRGGFLDRVDGFDERFFRITPREARAMDPQQRLLLE